MKLDQVILGIIIAAAVLYFGTMAIGLIAVSPWGIIGFIPIAVVIWILGVVIKQRLDNKEDDYYSKNVDK